MPPVGRPEERARGRPDSVSPMTANESTDRAPHPGKLDRRVGARPLTIVALALLGTVMSWATSPNPAAAHAIVTASSPADRTSLTTPPPYVSITFSETVSSSLGGLDVLDGEGRRVDEGTLERPSADTLRIGLRSGLADGTYIANYRVISADGHAISGAIVFGVGVSVDEGQADGVTKRTDPKAEAIGAIGRFLAYLGALGAAGAAFFLAFLGDGGPGATATGRVVRWLSVLAVAGSAGVITVQAALATGRGVGAVLDTAVLREVLASGLGAQTAVLLAGLAAVVIVPVTRGITAQLLALYGGLATVVAFVFWGHASEAPFVALAIAADVSHLLAAAIWFGGLLGLVVHVRARVAGTSHVNDAELLETPALATARLVVGFSTAAAIAVGVLWVAGTAMAWQTVGSFDKLFDGGYGRTLLAKLALVAALMAVAAVNRFRLVPAIIDDVEPETDAPANPPLPDRVHEGELLADATNTTDTTDTTDTRYTTTEPADGAVFDTRATPAWGRLVTTLRIEVIGIVAVLALTGVLVNLTPPRLADTAADRPVVQSAPLRVGKVDIVVSPARTGVNSIHLTYSDTDGRPIESVRKATVELRLPEKNIGPISREAIRGGAGHFILEGLTDFAVAGTWTIAVQTRTGEFDVERTEFSVPIAKG